MELRKLSHKLHNQKNRASWSQENTNSGGMMQKQSYCCLFVWGFEGQLSAEMQRFFSRQISSWLIVGTHASYRKCIFLYRIFLLLFYCKVIHCYTCIHLLNKNISSYRNPFEAQSSWNCEKVLPPRPNRPRSVPNRPHAEDQDSRQTE